MIQHGQQQGRTNYCGEVVQAVPYAVQHREKTEGVADLAKNVHFN
jgi:hypothetical protein